MLHLASRIVRAGTRRDPATGAVAVPIHQSATFEHPALGRSTGWDYGRSGNPTRAALEEAMAGLEGGARGLAFASGMAAIHGVLQLLEPGDHVVATEDLYGGTFRLLEDVLGLPCTFVDTTDPAAVRAAVRPETRMLLVESLTNPMMRVAALPPLVQVARETGALLVVDSTFLTPWLQRPLEVGADVVVHSASKYLSGHNDVIAGVVVARERETGERLARIQNAVGAVLGPQDSYLVLRGLKTLALRVERQQANARRIARALAADPHVERVHDPGVGGMLSFTLRDPALVPRVLASVRLVLFAESLGGVETLITFPAVQTHADVPAEIRDRLGITDRLLRLSVGIEDPDDVIQDLQAALAGSPARHEGPAHGLRG
jgi:cystathionine gamma-synthase